MKRTLILIFFLSCSVYAADCSTIKEMDTADTAVSSMKNWTDVNSFFHNFKQCDDGYIAEGLSSTIAGMLANNWSTAAQLEKISDNDRAFESWVLNHIDTTANDKDLDLIISNARDKCAEGNKKICAKIESAASQALQELKEE